MLESWSHLLLKKAPEIALEVADARVLDIGRGPFGLPLRPMVRHRMDAGSSFNRGRLT